MIINLDELNLGELLEVEHQRARDVVKCAIGLTIPCEINIDTTVCKFHFTVTCKAVIDNRKSLIPFHIAGALKELVEHRIDNIL